MTTTESLRSLSAKFMADPQPVARRFDTIFYRYTSPVHNLLSQGKREALRKLSL